MMPSGTMAASGMTKELRSRPLSALVSLVITPTRPRALPADDSQTYRSTHSYQSSSAELPSLSLAWR